jgi:GGDEF domain-containing protein
MRQGHDLAAMGIDEGMDAWDAVDFGVMRLDEEGRLRFANRWLRAHARPGAIIAGESLERCFGGAVAPALLAAVRRCLREGCATRLSAALHPQPLPLNRLGMPEGDRLWLAVDVLSADARPGADAGCWVLVRDMTDAVRREQRWQSRSRQLDDTLGRLTRAARTVEHHRVRLRAVARLIGAGLFETDVEGLLTHADSRAGEMIGADFVAGLGRRWTMVLPGGERAAADRFARWSAAAVRAETFRDDLPARGGGANRLRLDSLPLRNDLGEILGHLFTVRPTGETECGSAGETLAAPTTLPVTDDLDVLLRSRLLTRRPGDRPPLLLLVGIDRFGVPAAVPGPDDPRDTIAPRIAARLRRCVRDGDRVLRLSGDRFAVLLPSLPDDAVAQRVATQIGRALRLPVVTEHGPVFLDGSVGLTPPPLAATAADWRQAAEAALVAARATRRAAVVAAADDGLRRPGSDSRSGG